jgi:hypothetical protein
MYNLKWNWRPLPAQKIDNSIVYILGTGQSVNEYTEEDWQRIRNGYSIGLNMWVFHEFVPNVLQLELLSENEEYLDNLIKIFRKRQHEYSDTIIFFKSNYLLPWKYKNIHKFFRNMPKMLKKNIYLIVDFSVPGSNRSEFSRSVRWLDMVGFFNVKEKINFITAQARASLGLAVLFSIQSGFKHIALCGVDLINDHHFYDSANYYFDKYGIKNTIQKENISQHLTNDEKFSELTISRVLMIIYEMICKRQNITISVASVNSALYPQFPFTHQS